MKPSPLLFLIALLCATASATEPALKLDLGGGTSLDLILVPAGEFTQGSPESEPGRATDESARPVKLTHETYLGRTAVTRGQWERFIAETGYRTEAETGTSGGYGWDGAVLAQRKEFTWRNPGFPQTPDHPVCLVTFPDAQAFCAWLTKKTRREITLPTEAQWEYACRAGTITPWHGEDIAWHKANAGNGTRPVASKPANAWGFHIGGNVSEWCLDWYAPCSDGPATDPLQTDPNLSDKPRRVLRGGSWIRDAKNTRSAARFRADPRSRNADIGFRIVASLEAEETPRALPIDEDEWPPLESDSPPVEPTPPAKPSQAPHQETPARPSKPSANPFGGLLCLLIPLALVALLVRFLLNRSQSTPPTQNFLKPSHMPPPRPPIRKVDDGFWIDGTWPEGTLLRLRYVVAGVSAEQELLYRPGIEGQFVFTGGFPESVSIVAAEGGEELASTREESVSTPPPFPRDDDDDRREERRRPPIFPSAY
jgi:formylglycine-generating enzyme required for sulfatase activity